MWRHFEKVSYFQCVNYEDINISNVQAVSDQGEVLYYVINFIGKGFVGLTLAISLLYFLFRRFSSPVRDLSVPEDYFLLILLVQFRE